MLRRLLDAALDASVVLSFDRTGFRRHARRFRPGDLAVSLEGRCVLVTGANAGLGLAASRALAGLGAELVLLCRREAAGAEAAERLREESGNERVRAERLDVSSLADVRRFAERFGGRPVHALVHNAGALLGAREETEEGLERTFATHVAGPWLLTHALAPALRRAEGARVVWVASGGLYAVRLALSDPEWRERPFDGVRAYAEAKRMQVALLPELARRFRGSGVRVHAMHPGWADTGGVRRSLPRFHRVTRALLRTPEQGADTIVWLAAAREPGRSTARFWLDRRPAPLHLLPGTRETAAERRALARLLDARTGAARAPRAVRAAGPRTRAAAAAGSGAR